ncbi:hypothetical protein DSO57_1011950 [Entomophthora muscae]|uniref:Uncharacterized protein n=1 Tax=Entomophthora muscae TaxID=34485 RepID=A0ACC2U4K4_9FUNG|nr:hypothetical protein DSO57_1011950 [Entomophthora muscae]
MMEKIKPVLDTSYEPYISDGNQEDNNKPDFYRTVEKWLMLKKVVAFYNKVSMPCTPVINQYLDSTTPTKPAQKYIPDIKSIVVIHMCVALQARVDLASNKDNILKSDNVWLADDAVS